MASTKCPHCSAEILDQADTCSNCGQPAKTTPIHTLSGKLQAIGIVIIAISVVAMTAGTWWGLPYCFQARHFLSSDGSRKSPNFDAPRPTAIATASTNRLDELN